MKTISIVNTKIGNTFLVIFFVYLNSSEDRMQHSSHVPFSPRRSMCAVAWKDKILFYGGVGAQTLSESIYDISQELWLFDPCTGVFEAVVQAPHAPGARRCPAFISTDLGLELWGGSGLRETSRQPTHTFRNDWWIFDPACERWLLREESQDHRHCPEEGVLRPVPRYTPVFGKIGSRYWLFGGYTEDLLGKRKLNDLWTYDGAWTEIKTEAAPGYAFGCEWPGARYGCQWSFDESGFYVCGGFSDAGDHNDLWLFSSDTQGWRILSADSAAADVPAPRYCAAGALHDGYFYMFGGRSRCNPKLNYNDLWRFELSSNFWECILPQHDESQTPAVPGYHAKAASVIFRNHWYMGGGHYGHVSDFWRYDFALNNWELLFPLRPDDPILW
jgi:hypothetical protein